MDIINLTHAATLASATAARGEDAGFAATLSHRFVEGGWGMYPITLCLVIFLAIFVDRVVKLFITARTNKEAFLRGLKEHLFAGDLQKALDYVSSQRQTPLVSVVKAGLLNVPRGEASVQEAMDEAALRENPKLEARTGYLAMLGNAAMLCGLLGTVSGLIACFEAVAHVNPADKATILSSGISEAMNCTAFGLLTAIPALVAFSVLMGRTQHLLDEINETSVGVLNLVVANKEKLGVTAN